MLVRNPCGVVFMVPNRCQNTWSQFGNWRRYLTLIFQIQSFAQLCTFVRDCGRLWAERSSSSPPLPQVTPPVSCTRILLAAGARRGGSTSWRTRGSFPSSSRSVREGHFDISVSLFLFLTESFIRHVVLVGSSLLMPIINGNTFIYIALYMSAITKCYRAGAIIKNDAKVNKC